MSETIYSVHAYRWGNQENHSYLVGLYTEEEKAVSEAEAEKQWRGGKYECQVLAWAIGEFIDGEPGVPFQIIKPLPKVTVETIREGLSYREKQRNKIDTLTRALEVAEDVENILAEVRMNDGEYHPDFKEMADLIERLYRESEARGDALRDALSCLNSKTAFMQRFPQHRTTIEELKDGS